MNEDQPYQVMPSPSVEDYKTLEESILSQGVLEPVLYEENGFILDGHTREEICKKHGLDYPKNKLLGLSEKEKLEIAYDKNLARRHLTTSQKTKLVEARLIANPTLSDRSIANMLQVSKNTVGGARKRLVAGGQIAHVEKRTGLDGKSYEPPKPRTMQMLPPATKENTKIIAETAKAIRTVQKSAARQGNQDRLKAISDAMPKGEAGALPRKKFAVVYVDNPWLNEVYSDETGRDRDYPYPTMTVEEIKNLCAGDNSPALDDAVLFFWVTANRVDIGVDIIRAWEFNYKTHMIWDKVSVGTGRWVRDRHEVLMIATRGNNPPPCPLPGEQADSLYSEKKGKHSCKPEFFAKMIDGYYPDLPKLEMFQRESSLAPDDVRLNRTWTFWGNESSDNKEVPSKENNKKDLPLRHECSVDPNGQVLQGEPQEVLLYPECGKLKISARIELHPHEDKWMWSTSYSLPMPTAEGSTYKVGPKWGNFANCRNDALLLAVDELETRLATTSDSTRKSADKIVKWARGLL